MGTKIVSRIVNRLNKQGLKSSHGTDYNYHKVYQALNGRVTDENVLKCLVEVNKEDDANDSEIVFTIESWMSLRLGLKGNELIVFAVIYSMPNTTFSDVIEKLKTTTGASNLTIIKILNKLRDRNAISIEGDGVSATYKSLV